MRNGAISSQARLLTAVSELDATPAPALDVAAKRLLGVIETLIPGDISKVYLGVDGLGYYSVPPGWGRRIADLPPPWSASAWSHEHVVVAIRDSTGLLVTCRRSDVGTFRSLWPTIDYGHYWRPFGIENMVGAPVDFPAAYAYGLSPRQAEVFAFAGVGLSLPSIASILGLSVGTVRIDLAKAYTKTAVRSRAAATSALLDVVEPAALREAGRRLVPGRGGPLTRREMAVPRSSARGQTTSAIASVIGISTGTAKTHLANVNRKLGTEPVTGVALRGNPPGTGPWVCTDRRGDT